MILEFLEKFTDIGAIGLVEFGVGLGEVTDFRGDDRPAVLLQPDRHFVHGRALGDETGSGPTFRHVVVLRMRQRFEIIRAGLNRRRFEVDGEIGVVGVDDADVIEQKLVAVQLAEHAATEELADLRGGALLVVGIDLDHDRHLVRSVAFEPHLLHRRFVGPSARALGDGALDGIARHAGFSRFFEHREQPGVPLGIGTAELGCDGDFFDQFAHDLTLFEVYDRAFRVEPLTSHMGAACVAKRRG